MKLTPTLILLPVLAAHAFVNRTWDDAFAIANNLTSQMQLSEKLGVLIGTGQLNSTRRCVGDTYPVSRLGVPALCLEDGPAGVRLSKGVTGFPTGINTASTFSRRLMQARGQALGEEFRGKGIHVHLGPALDLMRNPKAGRAWESFGADPYMMGEGAYYTIQGIQSVGVQSCMKHFIANNQEHWRYGLSANVDDRTLREMYWYPFERGVEAGVVAVMCAYNRFNDTSSCHNAGLLGPNGILRNSGFRGYVMSDWGATHDSAADNANSGLDMEQPGDWILIGGGVFGGNGLQNAVNGGDVTQTRLNEMVSRVLAGWLKLGQDQGYPAVNFDSQEPDGSGPRNLNVSVRSDDHTALVREIASASAVLLHNTPSTAPNGINLGLPLDFSKLRSIAVVGQDAKMPNQNCGQLNECNDGTMSIGWGSGSNSLEFIVPPIDAIQSEVNAVNAAGGGLGGQPVTIATSLSNDLGDGPSAAKGKDVAFVFVNAMSGELGFYEIVVGNMGDRNDLTLWWSGVDLVTDVAAVCNNTIAIVHSVGPVYMPWNNNPNVTAIIYAGAPGEQTGPSIVDVITGRYNPRGRLPFSVADTEDAYGTKIVYDSLGFPDINYTEDLLIDYRYMDANGFTPRYEFGFGLSYTTFGYSSLSLSVVSPAPVAATSPTAPAVTLSYTITNTGSVTGTEIPQIYLSFPSGAGEPKMVLRGFEELQDLAPGESRTVQTTLTARDLSIWDVVSQSWLRPSGTFTVYVGASIKNIKLTATF